MLEAGCEGKIRFVEAEGYYVTLESRARDELNGGPRYSIEALTFSLVPLCDHAKKDWERLDTHNLDETLERCPYLNPQGFVSSDCGDRAIRGAREMSAWAAREQSIEAEFDRLLARAPRGQVPELWVCHAPPHDTVADLNHGGLRVGSKAIRRAIQRWLPRLTLHGHVHESVRLHEGAFWEMLPRQTTGRDGRMDNRL